MNEANQKQRLHTLATAKNPTKPRVLWETLLIVRSPPPCQQHSTPPWRSSNRVVGTLELRRTTQAARSCHLRGTSARRRCVRCGARTTVKEQLREDGTSVGRGLVAAIDFAVGEVVLQERGNCLKSPTVGTTSGGLICLNSALETVVSSKAEEGKLSVQSGPYAGSGGYIYKYGLVSGFSEFVCLFCPELLHIQIYLCVRYFKKKFFSFDWIIPYKNMDWFQLFQEKVF